MYYGYATFREGYFDNLLGLKKGSMSINFHEKDATVNYDSNFQIITDHHVNQKWLSPF